MKPYISLLLLLPISLLLLLHSSPATGHLDIVRKTCKKCSSGDPNVNYTLCVDSLNSIPKSHHASLKGLGVISTKLVLSKASPIKSKIKRLLKDDAAHHSSNTSARIRSCLKTCHELYSDSVPTLKDAARAIRARRYDDANVGLSSVVDAPGTCEDGFAEAKVASPLTEENREFFGRAVIALSITALLQEQGGGGGVGGH